MKFKARICPVKKMIDGTVCRVLADRKLSHLYRGFGCIYAHKNGKLQKTRVSTTSCVFEYFIFYLKYKKLTTQKNWDFEKRRYTVSARIIERSQEDKSTVKYRTFVLLRVPIRSGVGKFNYRTGRRTKVRYFTVLLSSWLRSIISGTDMIFTAYLYIYNL